MTFLRNSDISLATPAKDELLILIEPSSFFLLKFPFCKYDKLVSAIASVFISYFAGLFGIRCLKRHLSLKAASVSSIVTNSDGEQILTQCSTNVSKRSFTGASLTVCNAIKKGKRCSDIMSRNSSMPVPPGFYNNAGLLKYPRVLTWAECIKFVKYHEIVVKSNWLE